MNLCKSEVEKYVDDYLNNRNFFFYGRTLYPKRITRFLIFESKFKFSFREEIRIHGQEVTNRFIDRPPVFHMSHEEDDIKVTNEGIFFKGQTYDALKLVSDIVQRANDSIILVDGYIDRDTLDILSQKKKGVKVKIITYQVNSSLKLLASAFKKQHGDIEIHISRDMHDRFIVIDDVDYYHFGHSIKDLGGKGFMFSKIEEEIVKDAICQELSRIWNSTSNIVDY